MTEKRLGQSEFIALTAMLFASIAFSVDTMLPGLNDIGHELSPANPNLAQYVVSSFILGMGVGTLFVGPISDSLGRRPVIIGGAFLYVASCVVSFFAQSIEVLIASRVAMGLAAAGPRAVGLAIVRDLYSGRKMAQIMSFAMMVFSLVPAIAPLFGSFIIDIWGWREVFLGFIIFMFVTVTWFGLRQPETLPRDARRRFEFSRIWAGCVEVSKTPIVIISILLLGVSYGMLFGTLMTIQQTYEITFDRGQEFPWWFALTSILAMTSSFINASLVQRLGMRPMISAAKLGQTIFSALTAFVLWSGLLPQGMEFPVYFVWATSIFWMVGLTIGNLNALALEPMGHIAGLAASIVSCFGTVLGALIAIPIGLSFDGTPIPVMTGIAFTGFVGYLLVHLAKKQERLRPVSE